MSFLGPIIRDALLPDAPSDTADWFRTQFYMPDGRGFDEYAVPWVTAPQGPCWAWDNPRYNVLWLQWAARMFKTNFGLGVLMRRMATDPCDQMLASVDETNLKSINTRWWKMIERCPSLKHEAPPPRFQAKWQIKLARSICYGAWPRGKSRLADKSIPSGLANEIDKWPYNPATDLEGDPLPRFLKRGAEYPDRKFLLESTPGTKGRSRVEAGRLQGTNHQYHVPCPHCGRYQVIRFGDGEQPGGIFWDKPPSGNSDRSMARATAYYVCQYCEGTITDIHRPDMINAGVWVPFGCEVDDDRARRARELPPDDVSWLRGEPASDGNHYSSQINVFYALFHGWGQIADDFLSKRGRIGDLRQWTNEDKAETWELVRRQQTWEQLGAKIIVDVERGKVPDGHSVVTIAIDKQEAFYVWLVCSWNDRRTCHIVDYGVADSVGELSDLLGAKWTRDAGAPLKPSATLIDSGYRPADVHQFVAECEKRGVPIRACRGSGGQRMPGYYANRQNSQRSANPGQWVTWVDTHATQDWLEQRLHGDGLTLFNDSIADHQDLLEQLLNDGLVQSLNPQNLVREEWQRIDTMTPNDYRDCLRYAFVAMLLATRGGARMKARNGKKPKRKHMGPIPNLLERPGGWLAGVERQ